MRTATFSKPGKTTILVEADEFSECQEVIFATLEGYPASNVSFTMPVQDAAGKWVAIGHVFPRVDIHI